mmetsp:Transcript_44481/g.100531  ORF Transcript_44481/g.100531 Transcript_44481/m.100531 type:complete len:444 (+) Transcript_44481:272-1603(+)|eukprot:CAMPEP_0172636586 /NCGR_PEP_ID=MMETSP1068-20121228/204751_1 /TAXON_ID=35684 /ORGANISM="Pseudopedinella elastica, Strain CCMP716" /LENGTH=443 /DNA_ID=CAMNT_0013449041 /DNA_START=193 /DNA_END=1524 /DNA_ORIENTATION=+
MAADVPPLVVRWTSRPIWEVYFREALGIPPTKLASTSFPKVWRSKGKTKWTPATFRFEGPARALWCTCGSLDDLDLKDDLALILDRSEVAHLAPPTVVLPWDAEALPDQVPALLEKLALETTRGSRQQASTAVVAVKPACGSCGAGIEFVGGAEAVLAIVKRHAAAARAEDGFLADLEAQYGGRVPGWCVQGHVRSLLVKGGRKCHLRAYVVVAPGPRYAGGGREGQAGKKVWMYETVEVRVAAAPFSKAASGLPPSLLASSSSSFGGDDCRQPPPPLPHEQLRVLEEARGRGEGWGGEDFGDRAAHITNGAGGDATGRYLLGEVSELADLGGAVRLFLAELFGALEPTLSQGAARSRGEASRGGAGVETVAVAGVDLMVDGARRLWLLEVNRNPAAPPPGAVSDTFRAHLVSFARALAALGLGGNTTGFQDLGVVLRDQRAS